MDFVAFQMLNLMNLMEKLMRINDFDGFHLLMIMADHY